MKIALLGTRGVPANYGGFETCVQELGKRLVEKGHDVTVYCRKGYYENNIGVYLGMKLVCLPNVKKKSLDTVSHTFLSTWHALVQNFDVYMLFNAANSPFVIPLRLFGKRVVINTDGLEWKRHKWGCMGRLYYRMCERVACVVSNRLVSDSNGIKKHYERAHGIESTEIAYGAYVTNRSNPERLSELKIQPNEYFLQITRFEPENNPLLTIQAYKKLRTEKKLVLVGGNRYSSRYSRQIEAERSRQVILPGFIYDEALLSSLRCHCYTYIHGNEVGGTNPALLEAMGSGCFTVALNVPFNREVLTSCGLYYDKNINSLAEKIQWALDNEDKLDAFRQKAQRRISEYYSWEGVADQYERLFRNVVSRSYA